ncbi:MAG: mycofactocin biosynthesis glycosyltransferase MftF [Actinomycetota bacterium]|nr:mycofactocin biosynthesis glycosyltransferase MftF [Actinomycetota bacterium]
MPAVSDGARGPGGEPGPPGDPGLPAGWGLCLDRRTLRPRRKILIGGYPLRALRLTEGGARLVDTWVAGGVVPSGAGARRLGRLLTDRVVAQPLPPPIGDDPRPTVTAVIPVRDRADGVAITLAGMANDLGVVVVDDGSGDGAGVGAVTDLRRGPTTVVRHRRPRGPGAARNTGWREAATDVVAFVDADVELPPLWLARLLPHFSDPTIAAVAPRVTAVPGARSPAWLNAYEAVRSPLDLGPHPAPVRPRSPVPYVPTTALLVRRCALVELGGFDESLRTGEDVDLIWRLAAAGWRVRYEPAVIVGHPTRDRLGPWVAQRVGYGRSAAPLHVRHGSAVAPLIISPESAAAAVAGLFGHPVMAVAISASAVTMLAARLDQRLPRAALTRLAVEGQGRAMGSMAETARRVWWPLAAATAITCRRSRPALAAAFTLPPLVAWVRDRPALGPVRWSLLSVLDDLAYGAGVWAGVARTGRVGALAPVLRARLRAG